MLALVLRVPSRALAVAGGVAAAGGLGNLVASLVFRAALFGLRHPQLLRQPV